MLATLAQAKASSLRNIAGTCPTSADYLQLVNDATRRLMRRGDFPGTVVPIHVCVRQGCVVWPRYVGDVRRINVCSANVPVMGLWYDFLSYNDSNWGNGSTWWANNSWGSWLGGPVAMVSQGKSPVFQDILGTGRLVRAYASSNLDIGSTVTIFGRDANGQVLRTRSGATLTDGITLTLAAPFVSTTDYVQSIERVLLDSMQGDVRLYGYDVADDLLEDIATYEPGDTNPAFERYSLNMGGCTTGGCGCTSSVVALVKLKFVPARTDNDLVLIENLDALKLMCMCIKAEEASDRAGARAFETDAIRELNLGLNDQCPVDKVPVSMNPFGGSGIGRQQCF